MSRSVISTPDGGGSSISGLTAGYLVAALDATHIETPAGITTDQAMLFTSQLQVYTQGFNILDGIDPTKVLAFDLNDHSTGVALNINTGAQTGDHTLRIPVLGGDDTLMALGVANAVTGALTVRDSFKVLGSGDPTKTLRFELDAQTAGADLTIDSGAQTVDRTLSIPVLGANDTIVTLATAQTLTGLKSFQDSALLIVGSSDATKTLKFEVDAQTANADLTINVGAQTVDRTLSIPVLGGNDTLMTLGTAAAVTGAMTVLDSFKILGSADATKTLRFECDAQTANADLTFDTGAQTVDRTLTVPVLTGNRTLAVIDQAQTFSAAQAFSAAVVIGADPGGADLLRIGSSLTAAKPAGTDVNIQAVVPAVAAIAYGFNNSGGTNPFGIANNHAYFMCAQNFPFVIGTNGLVKLTIAGSGDVSLASTTAATSTTAAALVVPGGAGFGGAVLAGAAIASVSPSAGVGYATGAGGTVSQATSKATGVTLSKVCGAITMQAAALAAGAKVSFVVTNTACAATDVPSVAVASGGTANAYRASVTAVAAGSFTITVENITAGSLSESPVIAFSLGKAVTS